MTTWQISRGKMLISEVEEYLDSEGSRMYRPYVRYSYAVNGRQYTSDNAYRIYYGSSSRGEIEQFVKDHRAGRVVKVHYDTRNPESAYLVDNSVKAMLIITIVFTIMGFTTFLMIIGGIFFLVLAILSLFL